MRVVGLDIGGSRTRALLDEDGVTTARATGPSASLTAAGQGAAAHVLEDVVSQLATSGHLPPVDALCVGTSGSGDDSAVAWIGEHLMGLLRTSMASTLEAGTPPMVIVNDARLVLAAHELESGIALVAGTGSIAVGVRTGAEERSGGWGYLLGDEGSGYWVVREAVRELCRRHERHEPTGALGAVFAGIPVPELVAQFHEEPTPGQWAALAPAVLDADDAAAEVICSKAARHLAELVGSVAASMAQARSMPVIVAGGLGSRHARLSVATVEEIHRLVSGVAATVATRPSVEGAVRIARALAARVAV